MLHKYEDSLVSTYTDLGAQGLRNADQSGSTRVATVSSDVTDESLPIQDRLLGILEDVPGHNERKGFFPRGLLDVLITEKCVKDVLEANLGDSILPQVIDEHARKICGIPRLQNADHPPPSFKKIFVTLVLSERVKAIPFFIADNITDDDLPLDKIPTDRPKFFTLGRRNDNPGSAQEGLACFRKWTALDIRKFEEWQWTTLAPFFHPPQRKNVAHFTLEDQIPLPFTEDSRYSDDNDEDTNQRRLEFDGGNSNVFQVKIHPDHHAFHTFVSLNRFWVSIFLKLRWLTFT